MLGNGFFTVKRIKDEMGLTDREARSCLRCIRESKSYKTAVKGESVEVQGINYTPGNITAETFKERRKSPVELARVRKQKGFMAAPECYLLGKGL